MSKRLPAVAAAALALALGAPRALADQKTSSQTAPSLKRVIVKLREPAAAAAESALSGAELSLAAASASPALAGLMSANRVRSARPLYPGLLLRKIRQGRSDISLAQSVRERFHLEKIVPQYESLYERLLAEPTGHRRTEVPMPTTEPDGRRRVSGRTSN